MSQQNATRQGLLALGLIVGIVGGNFVLHRWILGSASTREADAGVTNTESMLDELDEFAPNRNPVATVIDPAVQRDRLKRLIQQKIPQATADELESWLEELSDVPLPVAEGVLELRRELNKLKSKDDSAPAPLPFELRR